MTDYRKRLGQSGEDAACQFLVHGGYRILERNYKTRFAEIDIIAEHDNTVLFVEVKARTSNRYGSPRDAVTAAKQKKIVMGAMHYLRENHLMDRSIRFDVITVDFVGSEIGIKQIPHAFYG